MTKKRLKMDNIQEIKELKRQGHSKRKVAEITGVNRETVIGYWDKDDLSPSTPNWIKKIDWEYVKKEAASGVSRKVLYEEQKELAALPSYQSFCQYLRNHREKKQPEVVIRQERNPGKSVEVDYSGNGREIVTPSTGEIHMAQLFVGTPGYSSHIYAEFTSTQQLEDFIMAHVHMFSFYGGVPESVIPDNCNTAVIKTNKYDPVINSTYMDMCKYYGITVDPADPASPRHKANVERAVGIIQKDFYSRIRNKTYTSLMSLNKDLKKWLQEINNRPMQGRGKSRNHYLGKELPLFSPLPSTPYEIFYFKKAKVHPDCHFQHNKNYYSVPYHFVGKEIDLKFNSRMINAYVNCEKIASHPTCRGTYHYSTNKKHFPEKKYVDTNWHLEQAGVAAQKAGPNVSILIKRLIKESKHPLKILRKVQGIMGLAKKYPEAIDYACEMALEFDRLNYDNIKRFAQNFKKEKKEIIKEKPLRQLQFIFLQGDDDDTNE